MPYPMPAALPNIYAAGVPVDCDLLLVRYR